MEILHFSYQSLTIFEYDIHVYTLVDKNTLFVLLSVNTRWELYGASWNEHYSYTIFKIFAVKSCKISVPQIVYEAS